MAGHSAAGGDYEKSKWSLIFPLQPFPSPLVSYSISLFIEHRYCARISVPTASLLFFECRLADINADQLSPRRFLLSQALAVMLLKGDLLTASPLPIYTHTNTLTQWSHQTHCMNIITLWQQKTRGDGVKDEIPGRRKMKTRARGRLAQRKRPVEI